MPYQEDVSAALKMAQEKAFREGDYYWPYDGRFGLPERPRPDSEDDLWEDEVVQETLTHSVLDMFGLSRIGWEPEVLHAAPLTPEITREVFGSEWPTRADYDRASDVMWDIVARDRGYGNGYGSYVVLYRDDAPDEIAFFGITGD
ncbi:hypothetical protein [Actinomadura alba]|uniref:hypothetical protein n=1 Tax=Actinomadura alba TaxID=406431 RepID=UPI001C9CDFE8|nr:hypothetical protein [Actinomadura alba]